MPFYQIFLRFSRGGVGIPYELARSEFTAVFGDHISDIYREWDAKHRMWVDLDLSREDVAERAPNLGYLDAVLHLQYESYKGEDLERQHRGRWYTGWVREQDQKILQTEVYVQDRDGLLAEAPSNRSFEIRESSGNRLAHGHRAHRALSVLDTRYIFNVIAPGSADEILDPFAGYGGFVMEALRRGLSMTASDIDPLLSPGLSSLLPNDYTVADARRLPYYTDQFDLIVTEPPFRTTYLQDVLDALPELLRVLKSSGQLILLIEEGMLTDVTQSLSDLDTRCETISTIPRNGGIKSPLLRITQNL